MAKAKNRPKTSRSRGADLDEQVESMRPLLGEDEPKPKRAKRGAAPTKPAAPPARRGRPPLPPRTTLAKWIRARDMRVSDLAAQMLKQADALGLDRSLVPPPKTLLDAVNARHKPSAPVMYLIRAVTDGEVDLEHWVRDLFDV